MSEPAPSTESAREVAFSTVLSEGFLGAKFGGVARSDKTTPWQRVVVRPVEIRGERVLQFSYFDDRKCTTKNVSPTEISTPLEELLAVGFAGIHLSTMTEEIDIRTSKKGKVLIGRRGKALADHQDGRATTGVEHHNRTKDVPLPEGKSNRLLEVMGILTTGGQVRPSMRSKFTQINEFLKHLLHSLDVADFKSLGRELEILDCGCGLSYLSLAVHHYLNEQLALPARITGVDVNDEVVRKSVVRAERLSVARLAFECGQIRDARVAPDIVLALHACDTATDDAIAQAITRGARLLLSVPCCHKHLNKAVRPEGEAGVLRPVLRHGILRQRTADLVTDSFRALTLRIMGYRTDVVEFVGTEHTPRNLMIRAARGAKVAQAEDVREYLAMRRFWNVNPYLETLLGERFTGLLKE
jgi:hypothetical protein